MQLATDTACVASLQPTSCQIRSSPVQALYEGLLLDVPLAPFFVAHLQGRLPLFDDLATLDREVHRSLLQLKR